MHDLEGEIMKLNCVIVCVDYADELSRSIDRWKRNVDELFVVTTMRDLRTLNLCHVHDVKVHTTDAFYWRGALFNKGLALNEAIEHLGLLHDCDTFLFTDADIIPPADYRVRLSMAEPKSGYLYGCPRHRENGVLIPDPPHELPGYHQLFFTDDPAAQRQPLLDPNWRHAGGADTMFKERWPADRRIKLNIPLTHIGQPGVNWCGVNRRDEMGKMLAGRNRQGPGINERI